MWLRVVSSNVKWLEITIRLLLKFNNEFDNCARWKRYIYWYIIWCVLDYTRAKNKEKRKKGKRRDCKTTLRIFSRKFWVFLSPEIVLNRGYIGERVIHNYIMSWSLKKSMRDVSLISYFFHVRSFPLLSLNRLEQRNKMIEKEPSVQSTFLKNLFQSRTEL